MLIYINRIDNLEERKMSMIHKFSMNGYNIVLDVDGGSVHILDDDAYELVDLYEENKKLGRLFPWGTWTERMGGCFVCTGV